MHRHHWGMGLLTATALAACGAYGDEELGKQSPTLNVNLPPVVAEMTCPEIAAGFPIDPEVARDLVPADYELYIRPDGMAHLNVVLEDCVKLDIDGVPHAPLQNALIWIRITGPFEHIEVPGTAESWDTAYWFNVNNFSTDHGLGDKLGKYGFPNARLASLDFPPLDQEGTGTATMTEHGHKVTTFTVQPDLLPTLVPIGLHHRIFSERGSNVSELFASCVVQLAASDLVIIEADPRSFLGGLLGETTYGTGISLDPVDCTVIWNSSRAKLE